MVRKTELPELCAWARRRRAMVLRALAVGTMDASEQNVRDAGIDSTSEQTFLDALQQTLTESSEAEREMSQYLLEDLATILLSLQHAEVDWIAAQATAPRWSYHFAHFEGFASMGTRFELRRWGIALSTEEREQEIQENEALLEYAEQYAIRYVKQVRRVVRRRSRAFVARRSTGISSPGRDVRASATKLESALCIMLPDTQYHVTPADLAEDWLEATDLWVHPFARKAKSGSRVQISLAMRDEIDEKKMQRARAANICYLSPRTLALALRDQDARLRNVDHSAVLHELGVGWDFERVKMRWRELFGAIVNMPRGQHPAHALRPACLEFLRAFVQGTG